jgi:hypothetical protein
MKTVDANLVLGRPGTHASGVAGAAELLAEMDAHEVERGLVTHVAGAVHEPATGNRLLFAEVSSAAAHEGRLIPVPVAGPGAGPGAELWQQWQDAGVRGVRACPDFYHYPEAEVDALLAGLVARGWFLQLPLAPVYGAPWRCATVARAAAWAGRCEGLRVLITGTHRNDLAELRAAMKSHADIWLDVGNQTTGTGVELLVGDGFGDRLVCGSGFGVSYIASFRDVVRCADVPEETRTAVLRGNALKLLESTGIQ